MNDVFSAGDVQEKPVANIYAASFVYARDVQLVTVNVDGGRSAIFIFNNADGGVDRALQEYYGGGLISGRALHEALRVLKEEADIARGRPPRPERLRP